jgi:hypothetical protein
MELPQFQVLEVLQEITAQTLQTHQLHSKQTVMVDYRELVEVEAVQKLLQDLLVEMAEMVNKEAMVG